jgi:hypothetical protein
MRSALRWAALALVVVPALASAQAPKYSVKTENTAPPKELKDGIRQLLSEKSVQFLDAKGELLAEFWFRKEVPADATPEQVKNGITYQEVPQTTILGAVRFDKPTTDFRKQKVKAGVYTIRLAFQPQDGDHMGTAPYPEFGALIAAANDTSADTMEPKKMQELSTQSIGTSHPAVFLLYPNAKPGAAPQVVAQENNRVVLNTKEAVSVKGKKTDGVLGIGLTLIGHAD